jgi:hypothetical protein
MSRAGDHPRKSIFNVQEPTGAISNYFPGEGGAGQHFGHDAVLGGTEHRRVQRHEEERVMLIYAIALSHNSRCNCSRNRV